MHDKKKMNIIHCKAVLVVYRDGFVADGKRCLYLFRICGIMIGKSSCLYSKGTVFYVPKTI